MARFIADRYWGDHPRHAVSLFGKAGTDVVNTLLRDVRCETYPGFAQYTWDLVYHRDGAVDEIVFTFSDPDAAFAFKLRWA